MKLLILFAIKFQFIFARWLDLLETFALAGYLLFTNTQFDILIAINSFIDNLAINPL